MTGGIKTRNLIDWYIQHMHKAKQAHKNCKINI